MSSLLEKRIMNPRLSLHGVGEARGYDVCNQDLFGVFSLGGVGIYHIASVNVVHRND